MSKLRACILHDKHVNACIQCVHAECASLTARIAELEGENDRLKKQLDEYGISGTSIERMQSRINTAESKLDAVRGKVEVLLDYCDDSSEWEGIPDIDDFCREILNIINKEEPK